MVTPDVEEMKDIDIIFIAGDVFDRPVPLHHPDIALVILRQCFSNAIYEDRKTIDFKNIYDAVRTTKAVYPDVIKKELVNFKEIFKDELKAENIVIE